MKASNNRSAKPKALSKNSLLIAVFAIKHSVRDLFRLRATPCLRLELKEQIAALREVSRCYMATKSHEERRAA